MFYCIVKSWLWQFLFILLGMICKMTNSISYDCITRSGLFAFSMNEWMNSDSLLTHCSHFSCHYYCLAHWTSNIWHHKCYCSLKSNTSHNIFLYLMIIYIPNFTYLAPVVYWISDWQFAKEFYTSATLLLHIIWERLPLQNFHIFWRFIIIHPPLQLSNSHSTCCSSLVGWHTCHVTFHWL
jgi:hypothetical protein